MKAVLLENHPLLRAGLAHMPAHPALGLDVGAPECQDWSQEAPQLADLLVIGVDEAFGTLDAARLRDVVARSTARHVVVLAARVSPEEAHAAMLCGVDAYVAKAQSPQVLLATLQLVLAGGQSYPPLMPRAAVPTAPVPMQAIDAAEAAQRLSVSQRQYEVLVLLSRGHSVKGVGRLLGISEATVKTHACTLYRRLNVRNKSEAVYAVMRLGIPLELQGGPPATAAFVSVDSPDDAACDASGDVAPAAVASAHAPAVVSPRFAANDHTAQSRWAAMTRAFGMSGEPVRVANGTRRSGMV